MQTEEGGAFLESPARWDRIVDVQLPVAALEIAAPNPGAIKVARASERSSHGPASRRSAEGRFFGHGAPRIVPQRPSGFKLFA